MDSAHVSAAINCSSQIHTDLRSVDALFIGLRRPVAIVFRELFCNFSRIQICSDLLNSCYEKTYALLHLSGLRVIIFRMGEKKPKTLLTVDQLKRFAADMHSQANAVEGFVKRAEELGLTELDVNNYASGLQGIDKLSKFTGSIFTAVAKLSLEQPLREKVNQSVSAAKKVADEASQYERPKPRRKGDPKP